MTTSSYTCPRSGGVYGSNDGNTWTFIYSYTSTAVYQESWIIPVNSSAFFTYYKITIETAWGSVSSTYAMGAVEITFHGEEMISGVPDYTHGWAAHYPSSYFIKY